MRLAFGIVVTLLLQLPSVALSQREEPTPQALPARSFQFDALAYRTQDVAADSVRLDVYIAVPYASLHFLYAVEKYVADYATIVEVTELDSRSRVGNSYKTYSVTDVAPQTERTQAKRSHATQQTFRVKAGTRYGIRISIRDLSANTAGIFKGEGLPAMDTLVEIVTPRFDPASPSVSSLMLTRARRGLQVTPYIGADIGEYLDAANKSKFGVTTGLFAEVYGLAAGTYGIVADIRPIADGELIDDPARPAERWTSTLVSSESGAAQTAPQKATRTPVFLDIAPCELWSGDYLITLHVLPTVQDTSITHERELRTRAIASVTKQVTVPWTLGIPLTAENIDDAIAQLGYIASGREWDSLTLAETVREKRQAIVDFWIKRDPDPDSRGNEAMDVFYSRVAYANATFGFGQQGWRSDRARVYIALGRPTNTIREAYSPGAPPYEVWEYFDLNARYAFTDPYLLGEYRLVGPPPRQGVFLWERDSR